jgi:RNA polymerase sigma-70 factor (ECF subfamily)
MVWFDTAEPAVVRSAAGRDLLLGFHSEEDLGMASPEELRAWFGQVVQENYRLFFTKAYGILQNPSDAEEAVERAVLRAYEKLHTLKDPRTVVPWLAQITARAAYDSRRKGTWRHVRTVGDEVAILEGQGGSEDEGLDDDQKHILLEEVSKLPDGEAEVVMLRHVEDLSYQDIAERLGCPVSTVRVRHFYAMQRLRRSPRLRRAVGMDS